MARSAQDQKDRVSGPQRIVIGAAVGIVAAAAAIFAMSPGMRESMLREDGPIETLTAAIFLAAAVVGARRWARSPYPAWSWAVPVFAFVAFLDELSFGIRVFGWTPPRVSGIDVDSLHDIFDLAERWAEGAGLRRTHLALIALAGLGVVAASLATGGRGRRVSDWLRAHPPIAWLAAAPAGLLLAITFDLAGSSQVARLIEETLEFAVAALILVGAFAIGRGDRPS